MTGVAVSVHPTLFAPTGRENGSSPSGPLHLIGSFKLLDLPRVLVLRKKSKACERGMFLEVLLVAMRSLGLPKGRLLGCCSNEE